MCTSSKCVCDSGKFWNGSQCEAISCSAYSGTSTSNTGGVAGKANDGQTDCKCPSGATWDSTNGCIKQCTPSCSESQCKICDTSNGTCVDDGNVKGKTGNGSTCSYNCQCSSGNCTSEHCCPSGQEWDGDLCVSASAPTCLVDSGEACELNIPNATNENRGDNHKIAYTDCWCKVGYKYIRNCGADTCTCQKVGDSGVGYYTHDEYCNDDCECDSELGLICQGNKCICTSNQEWTTDVYVGGIQKSARCCPKPTQEVQFCGYPPIVPGWTKLAYLQNLAIGLWDQNTGCPKYIIKEENVGKDCQSGYECIDGVCVDPNASQSGDECIDGVCVDPNASDETDDSKCTENSNCCTVINGKNKLLSTFGSSLKLAIECCDNTPVQLSNGSYACSCPSGETISNQTFQTYASGSDRDYYLCCNNGWYGDLYRPDWCGCPGNGQQSEISTNLCCSGGKEYNTTDRDYTKENDSCRCLNGDGTFIVNSNCIYCVGNKGNFVKSGSWYKHDMGTSRYTGTVATAIDSVKASSLDVFKECCLASEGTICEGSSFVCPGAGVDSEEYYGCMFFDNQCCLIYNSETASCGGTQKIFAPLIGTLDNNGVCRVVN